MEVKIRLENNYSCPASDERYISNFALPDSLSVPTGLSKRVVFDTAKKVTIRHSDFNSSGASGVIEYVSLPSAAFNKYFQTDEDGKVNPPATAKLNEYLLKFKSTSRSNSLEYGMVSGCDELVSLWLKKSPSSFGAIINHIFLQSINDKYILLSLLKAISNVPYSSIYPFGQTIAVAALVNRDVEVAEGGIRAFENWGSSDGISVLESNKLAYDWLEIYREQTIEYLRDL